VFASAVAVTALALTSLPPPATEIAAFDPASIDVAPVAQAAPATATPTTPPPRRLAATPSTATSTTAAPTTTSMTPTTTPTTTTLPLTPIKQALWSGDSIAFDLSPAVEAALGAAGVPVNHFQTAFVGHRLGRPGEETALVESVREQIDALGADLVILQFSVWDAQLDADEQLVVLTSFRDLVLQHGARLVLVNAPVVGDEPTNSGLVTMSAAAQQLSAADPEHVIYLDAATVWGTEFAVDLDGDGTPERKRDLVHVCPSGAARFAAWLTGELSSRFAAVTPAPPTAWAAGAWVTDDRYDSPVGSCAPL
jgi:hypothetical protein